MEQVEAGAEARFCVRVGGYLVCLHKPILLLTSASHSLGPGRHALDLSRPSFHTSRAAVEVFADGPTGSWETNAIL